MHIGLGELVGELEYFEASYAGVNKHYSCVSNSTRDEMQRWMIESYKRTLSRYTRDRGVTPNIRKSAKQAIYLLDKAIAGETRFEQELKNLSPKNGFPSKFRMIFGTNFDALPRSHKLDEIIKRLYLKANQ